MGGTIKDPMGEVRDLSGSCTIEQLKAVVVAVKAAGRRTLLSMSLSDGEQTAVLHCEMEKACTEPVTHIDHKGYVYCTGHGVQRRGIMPCRKLRLHEVRKLQRGETLTY